MENKIIKKENGNIIESKRIKLVSSKSYLTDDERCFENIINQENLKNSLKSDAQSIRRAIHHMINIVSNSKDGYIIISSLYKQICNTNSEEDLKNSLNILRQEYKTLISSKDKKTYSVNESLLERTFNKALIENKDLTISIFVKKIVSSYFLSTILNLNLENISELQNLKINNSSIEKIFEYINEKPNEVSKENGVYELSKNILLDTIDIAFDEMQLHLCWENCSKATASDCKKVSDIIKQKIDKYDFITDGYQVLNKYGEVEEFVVSKCNNYEKAEPKVITTKQRAKLKESLFISYYNALSLNEAYAIQESIQKNNGLRYNDIETTSIKPKTYKKD